MTEFLASLPAERQRAMSAIRQAILDGLPDGYEEQMLGGMIAYVVPFSLFPSGYHCNPKQPLLYAALACQKNYMSLYLMAVYGHEETRKWFELRFAQSGKRLDMGKSCVRFKQVEDVPLDVIRDTIGRVSVEAYLDSYTRVRSAAKIRKNGT